jgi:hypothetical protein
MLEGHASVKLLYHRVRAYVEAYPLVDLRKCKSDRYRNVGACEVIDMSLRAPLPASITSYQNAVTAAETIPSTAPRVS